MESTAFRLPASRKFTTCSPEAEKEHEQSRENSSDCTFCQENNGIRVMLEYTETDH